jgi:hypothetical protein
MQRGVALPSDEILKLLILPKESCLEYLLDFPFGFTFYDVWWWFNEVWAMLFHFLILGEEGGMENVVDFPMWG